MVIWFNSSMVIYLNGYMVIWFNDYMVIAVYSNQFEWFIPKTFIPIWLMIIGFYIVIVSSNCNLK